MLPYHGLDVAAVGEVLLSSRAASRPLMPELMTAILMLHSFEAIGLSERSTLGELSNHSESVGNVPICRELSDEHVSDNTLLVDDGWSP